MVKFKTPITMVKKLLSFFVSPLSFHLNNGVLLLKATKADLRSMYAGSALGLLWVVLAPMLFMAIYSSIYVFVFRVKPVGMALEDYLLNMFIGLLPYTFFSNCLMQSSNLFRASPQAVFSTTFPSELLVSKSILAHGVALLSGFMILVIVAVFLKGLVIIPILFLLGLTLLLFTLFVMGFSWLVALVGVVLKDFSMILGYLMLLLLVGTPISYTMEMVPEQLQKIVYLNPFAHFVLLFQRLILSQGPFPFALLILVTIESLLVFAMGYAIYGKTKRYFFDFI